ncbi:short chain dehydrogenase [Tubulinosema ratisbonensis]|uniref:Short chain dehydrogenase n=1 Tax=Tubulinosema ratisbonensis TaxID=291195 RepID=A0A437AIZ6_9MICR|nr:short chain dehydrogenase [Tubulinosema ratisbonensis]
MADYWLNKKVGITGGASGLGLRISIILESKGAKITIIDRVDDPKFSFDYNYLQFDLSKGIPDLKDYNFDVFISNAAIFSGYKPFSKFSDEEITNNILVNVLAPTLLLKNIKCTKHVLINSVCSLSGLINISLYCASKSFLKTLNESLRREGMNTLIYYPFKINTNMFKDLNDRFVLKVEDVANDIIKSIEKNKKEVFNPFYYRFVFLFGFFPNCFTDLIYKWIDKFFKR